MEEGEGRLATTQLARECSSAHAVFAIRVVRVRVEVCVYLSGNKRERGRRMSGYGCCANCSRALFIIMNIVFVVRRSDGARRRP